jgi:small ligand-binding sensory domain FIST
MKWASTISERARLEEAVEEGVSCLLTDLGGARADLVVVFVSPHHAPAYARVPALVRARLPGALVLGCSADGVIGAGREREHSRAISLTAAALPGVTLTPVRVAAERMAAADGVDGHWRRATGVDPAERNAFVLLADPLTCDAQDMLAGLDETYANAPTVGGLASGAGRNALFLAGETHGDGVVGVALQGNVEVEAVLARGCRTLGRPMFVTRHDDNVILELDGRPPLQVLETLHDAMTEEDRALLRTGLRMGLEAHPQGVEFREGDLLARSILGMDPESGALAVGAPVQQWQVAQFQLSDAKEAARELAACLERYRAAAGAPPGGALLFSCLGRGQHFFGKPDHDTELFTRHVGHVPLGGFFCRGEIGPVNGGTFLHGQTSAFAMFRPARGA